MKQRWRGLAALLLLGLTAATQTPEPTPAALPDGFAELRAKDERVARIGYELATRNAAFCDDLTPATGLLLHDLGAYGKRDEMRRALGLPGDIAIQVVVPGSPAALANLKPDQAIAGIAGLKTADLALDPEKRWERLETIRMAIAEQTKANGGLLGIEIIGQLPFWLRGTPACTSRFEVGPIKKRAVADGTRVVIGDEFPGHAWPDELLAGVMAHELAHNVLKHRVWLDANGRKQKWVRLTEREADRLAPWLLANAGYEPSAAVRFMATWGPDHSGGIFRKRTHEGWDERVEHIAAEAKLVETALAKTGKADWRAHFKREDLPNRDR